MDIWDEIKKLQGYQSGNGRVDSYGVDHSGFSTRDELEYQSARLARENLLAENFSKQGIAEENYPQLGTNFWGGTPENNYGFGTSNIKQNIENMTNGLNNTGTNIGQGLINQDYTINTKSLISQPSSYFLSNNSVYNNNNTDGLNEYQKAMLKVAQAQAQGSYMSNSTGTDNTTGWSDNTSGFGGNLSFATTSTQQNQTPAPWSTPAAQISPVPWRDNQTLASWAGGYDLSAPTQNNGNYISDEDLYARMWENIKEQESVIPHPYLDTKGLITIGGGANVNDWNVFKNLNVTVGGVPATEAQKREAYNRMRQLSEEKDAEGNYVNRNMKAKFFENKTNIRISDAEARGLAQNHMNNDLAHLRGEFSDFDNFPLPLKEVLLDIQYNTGNLNQQNWPNLYQAIANKNVSGENGIVDNVNRKDVQQERNDWAKRKARSIRF